MVKDQLGRRLLRDGSRGPDVATLQQRLAELGYDSGPVDGVFGLLTEEAILRLQRDFGLRVDGVAGPAVMRVLREGPSTGLRVMHLVEKGDTVTGLAERYRVSTRYFRECQRIRRDKDLFPGRRLAIPVRPVYGLITGSEDPERLRNSLARHYELLTSLIVPWYVVTSAGALDGKLRQDLWEWSKSRLFPLIPQVRIAENSGPWARRARRRAADEVAQAARRFGNPAVALVPSVEAPPEGLGYLSLAHEIKAKLPRKTQLIVELPRPPQSGSFYPGPSPAEFAAAADRVLITPSLPSKPEARVEPGEGEGGAATLRRLIKGLLAQAPCWKVLPVVDVTDLEVLPQFSLINRFNLGGAVLTGLGRDREFVWRGITDRFSPAPHRA